VCPGYRGAQDTFYVGTLKGVGRVYQQTLIDTYAKVAFTKLYDRKTPITAAEILNLKAVIRNQHQGRQRCQQEKFDGASMRQTRGTTSEQSPRQPRSPSATMSAACSPPPAPLSCRARYLARRQRATILRNS